MKKRFKKLLIVILVYLTISTILCKSVNANADSMPTATPTPTPTPCPVTDSDACTKLCNGETYSCIKCLLDGTGYKIEENLVKKNGVLDTNLFNTYCTCKLNEVRRDEVSKGLSFLDARKILRFSFPNSCNIRGATVTGYVGCCCIGKLKETNKPACCETYPSFTQGINCLSRATPTPTPQNINATTTGSSNTTSFSVGDTIQNTETETYIAPSVNETNTFTETTEESAGELSD